MSSSTCKKWLAENFNTTGCKACHISTRQVTSNVAVPRQSAHCQAMLCDYNNGIVSPTTPLGYGGQLMVQSESKSSCEQSNSASSSSSTSCSNGPVPPTKTDAGCANNKQASPFSSSSIMTNIGSRPSITYQI